MNFRPDKQLFLVAGAGDQTTEPLDYKASGLPLRHDDSLKITVIAIR